MAERPRSTTTIIVATAVFLGGLIWAWRPLWNVDIFWHIATGRLIQTSGLPTQDVFSAVDPTAPWSTFQWLYQLGVAGLDDVFGLAGVRAAHALVYAAALAAWSQMVCRKSGPMAALCLVAVLLLLFEDRLRARPHLLELLFVAPLLYDLDSQEISPRRVALVVLAPLWANLHAVSSLWWVALYGAWAVPNRDRRALVLWGAGIAAIVVAPGAWSGLTGALGSHAAWPASFVPELRRTWFYASEGPWGLAVLAGVALGGMATVALWRTESGWSERLAAVGCTLAALLMARWAWFAAVPVALLLMHQPPKGHRALLLFAIPPLLLVGPRWTVSERTAVLEPGTFPEASADWLDANGLRLPTDTDPTWSGYLLYRLYPGTTLLADGRLVFGEPVADLLRRRFAGDTNSFTEAVGRFHTLALVYPTGQLPELNPKLWRQVHSDPVAEVWLPKPAWGLLPTTAE